MDAVLAGDHPALCGEKGPEEAVLGETLPPSPFLNCADATLVSTKGALGLVRSLARCTTVDLPPVPLSLPSKAAMRSESFETWLAFDSAEPSGRVELSPFTLLLPSVWPSPKPSNRTERLRCGA